MKIVIYYFEVLILFGLVSLLSCSGNHSSNSGKSDFTSQKGTVLWNATIGKLNVDCIQDHDTIYFQPSKKEKTTPIRVIISGLEENAVQAPSLLPYHGNCSLLEESPKAFVNISTSTVLAAFRQEWKSRVSFLAIRSNFRNGKDELETSKVMYCSNSLLPVDLDSLTMIIHNEPIFQENALSRKYLIRRIQLDDENLLFSPYSMDYWVEEPEIKGDQPYRKLLEVFCNNLREK